MTAEGSSPRPFFQTLHDLLDAEEGAVTLGALLDAAGEQTYGLLVLLLALPSLIPAVNVPAALGGGSAIMGLGWQMARGVPHPWVPERLQAMELQKGNIKAALARLERLLAGVRSERLERRPLSQRWMGVLVTWAGFLLFLPLPLPLANVLPAAVLGLLGTALLEERPLLGWIGAAGTLGITIYFGLSFKLVLRELRGGWAWLSGKFA